MFNFLASAKNRGFLSVCVHNSGCSQRKCSTSRSQCISVRIKINKYGAKLTRNMQEHVQIEIKEGTSMESIDDKM